MLRAMSAAFAEQYEMDVYDRVTKLPVFSPDLECGPLPIEIDRFVALVAASDAVIVASPEYVRGIPGGLKNALDWLVSRTEIVGKPVFLMHASRRGDDMLAQLRLVLSTVSERFSERIFFRIDLLGSTPEQIEEVITRSEKIEALRDFLRAVAEDVARTPASHT